MRWRVKKNPNSKIFPCLLKARGRYPWISKQRVRSTVRTGYKIGVYFGRGEAAADNRRSIEREISMAACSRHTEQSRARYIHCAIPLADRSIFCSPWTQVLPLACSEQNATCCPVSWPICCFWQFCSGLLTVASCLSRIALFAPEMDDCFHLQAIEKEVGA